MSGININGIKDLKRQLEKLEKGTDKFIEDCAKELAARLLREVKQRTPRDTGYLKNHWQTTGVIKQGPTYTIMVINQTEYAMYVEFGHRTRNGRGWVPGRFMLKISVDDIQSKAEGILERRIAQKLGEYLK